MADDTATAVDPDPDPPSVFDQPPSALNAPSTAVAQQPAPSSSGFTASEQSDWDKLQNTDEKTWSPELRSKAGALTLKYQSRNDDGAEKPPDSGLSVSAKKEPEPDKSTLPPPATPSTKDSPMAGETIYGRSTIFHYNYDGSRDKEDPGSSGFFGNNLDDKNLAGVAVPVDILESLYGKFTKSNPDGSYSQLDTPEGKDAIERIKHSHVTVTTPAGEKVDLPIVDIQGSYKHWHRAIDLTYGAAAKIGVKDDSYLGYTISGGDGTPMTLGKDFSDHAPLTEMRRKGGDKFTNVTDQALLDNAHEKLAPAMPKDKFEEAMRSPDGKETIQRFEAEATSPIEVIRKEFPKLSKVPDSQLVGSLYSNLVKSKDIDPQVISLGDFSDRMLPKPSALQSIANLVVEDSAFQRGLDRKSSAMTHQMAAKAWDLPADVAAVEDKIFGSIPLAKKAHEWVDKNTKLGDYFRGFVGYFHGIAQAQEKQGQVDENRAKQAGGIEGKVGSIVGGAGTNMALNAPLLFSGAPISQIAAVAGVYEGMTTAGEAAQKNQDNFLLQGIESGGMTALGLYMANSPSGRMTAGFNMWVAGTGEQTLSDWLQGKKLDWENVAIRSVADISTGIILSAGKEKGPYRDDMPTLDTLTRDGEPGAASILIPKGGPTALPYGGPRMSGDEGFTLGAGQEPTHPYVERLEQPTADETVHGGEQGDASILLPRQSPSALPYGAPRMGGDAGFTLGAGAEPTDAFTEQLGSQLQPKVEVDVASEFDFNKGGLHPAVQAELKAAEKAKDEGNSQEMSEHMNRALSMQSGNEQKAIAEQVIKFTKDVSNNKTAPGREPPTPLSATEKIVTDHFFGMSDIDQESGEETDPKVEIEDHFKVEDHAEPDWSVSAEKEPEKEPDWESTPEGKAYMAKAQAEGESEGKEAVAEASIPILKLVAQHGGLPSPARLKALAKEKGENLTGELSRVHAAWKALTPEAKNWLKGQGIGRDSIFRRDASGLDEFNANLGQSAGAHFSTPAEMLERVEQAINAAAKKEHVNAQDFGDAEYSSGLNPKVIGKGLEDVETALGKTEAARTFKSEFNPEKLSRSAGRMADIAKERTSESKYNTAAIPFEIAHAMKLDNILRGSEKVLRRLAYFNKFNRAQLKEMLVAHEAGRSTGNKIADRLLEFHDTVYKALEKAEKIAGIKYEVKEWYIYHALKGGRAEKERFEHYMNNLVAGDPKFTYQRKLPTWEEVFKHGFEPASYSPERLLQMRIGQSMMALKKIMTLRDAEKSGLAYPSKSPTLPASIKSNWGAVVRAPNGETYFVQPEAQTVLHRAWDDTSLYNLQVVGIPFKILAMAKGITGLKLGWSVVHGKHMSKMSVTNSFVQISKMALTGQARGDAFHREMENIMKLGMRDIRKGESWREPLVASPEVQTWQGKRAESTLTPDQKQNLEHAKMAGLDFSMNPERELGLVSYWAKIFPKTTEQIPAPVRDVISVGYDWISSGVFQKFLFGAVVPTQKFSAFLSMRDGLIREHPELARTENRAQLRAELSKIGKTIEARFGEMFYDNLLWRKVWKDAGTSLLMSLGWNLSALRIYAGGAHDTSAFVAKGLQGKATRDMITDRMLFTAWYSVLNIGEAAVITTVSDLLFNKGKNPIPWGMDYVFPRIGVNSDGSAARVSPVEFSREIASWDAHIKKAGGYTSPTGILRGTADLAQNKMQPFLSSLTEYWQNKNFFGQQIVDPNESKLKQWGDTVNHFLTSNLVPIPFQGMVQPSGQPYGWKDAMYAALGYPRAAAWTNRTDTQNRIVDTFQRLNPKVKTEAQEKVSAGYEKLRNAVAEKKPEEVQQAIHDLKAQGASGRAIREIIDHPGVSYPQYAFKHLPVDQQQLLYGNMSPEERKEYLPLVAAKHRAIFPQ